MEDGSLPQTRGALQAASTLSVRARISALCWIAQICVANLTLRIREQTLGLPLYAQWPGSIYCQRSIGYGAIGRYDLRPIGLEGEG